MTYFTESAGDVWILHLKGEVWGGWDIIELKDTVARLVQDGGRKFLVDMSRTNYVSSNGIGVLVAILAMLKKTESRLGICSVSVRSERAFKVTGVWKLFERYEDETEGLRSLASRAARGPSTSSHLQSSPHMG